MKKTKIVCTIGPKSEDKETLRELIENGLNVVRLNFSHGDFAEHQARIDTVKELREEMNREVAILLDTKGPEIRTGKFSEDEIVLTEGQMFTLVTCDCVGDENMCQVSYVGLANDVKLGDKILIDDGLVGLEVVSVEPNKVRCIVQNTGVIKDHKGVNVPNVKINLPPITQKDIDDIKFGIKNEIDFVAASFIRKASDVMAIRKVLEENGGHDIHIISKIENQEGVDNIDEIIEVSDGIMVARGDLGVEIPIEEVPKVQKMLIKKCNRAGKPVITATQMLDSMMRNPRPTRAEVTDVANAIYDGTDAIMLSGETASGKYPVESVKIMARIAESTEDELRYDLVPREIIRDAMDDSVTFALSHATCDTAIDLDAKAIITATSSGFTARKLSRFRPKSEIIAACTSDKVMRKLSIIWGVRTIKIDNSDTTEEIFANAIKRTKERGFVDDGDLVVITAGVPVGVAGATNMMNVQIVGELLLKGKGLGGGRVSGKACVAANAEECAESFEDGDILVVNSTDKDMMTYIERAGALIVEEGGYTSHGAIVALELKKPAVIGVQGATSKIKNGMIITCDAKKGVCYVGKTRVL